MTPGDIAKSISIEAAELLENFQWSNPSMEELKNDAKKLSAVKNELADVLIYAYEMALFLNLDPGDIMREKLERARTKYPADLMKNAGERVDDNYHQIKAQYRSSDNQT